LQSTVRAVREPEAFRSSGLSVTSELDDLYGHHLNTIMRLITAWNGKLFARDGTDQAELRASAIGGPQ
jgi:hypothetical protein